MKKRMFRSNMMVLFVVLLALFLIVVFALVIFEDSVERHGGTAQALPSEGGLLIRLRFPKENSYGEDTDC